MFVEELLGHPHVRLSELLQLPDEDLLALKPAFLPGVTVFADAGRMLGRCPGREPDDLYGLDEAGTFVLSRFDGWSRLHEIAAELVSARAWSAPDAQALAKEVFAKLLLLRLCVPANKAGDGDPVTVLAGRVSRGGNHE